MKPSVLWVVDPSIKRFFPPLKGPFEVVGEEEFFRRLREGLPEGPLLVAPAGPESLRQRVRAGLEGIAGEVFLWEEAPEELRREVLRALAEGPSPEEIEPESFALISSLVDLSSFPEEAHPLILRLIHAAGDPDLIRTLVLHPGAVRAAVSLLREGFPVIADVEMVAAGINRRLLSGLGGGVLSAVAAGEDPPPGLTRTAHGMRKLLEEVEAGVVAVGNAPTALLEAMRVLSERPRPVVVIGFPVGFVRAAEAKLLLTRQPYPYLTNYGARGGSALAAAAVNALLRMAHGPA